MHKGFPLPVRMLSGVPRIRGRLKLNKYVSVELICDISGLSVKFSSAVPATGIKKKI